MGGRRGSWRVKPLPADWAWRRRVVFERDGFQCVFVEGGVRCPASATDCDHVDPLGGDELSNLRALCGPHHRRVSASQAGRRVHKRARMPHPVRRPEEGHPGDPG